MHLHRLTRAIPAILLSLLLTVPAPAVIISAALTDLADLPGEDRWQASYLLSDGPFPLDQGFTIYFDHLRYANLSDVQAPAPAGWDYLTVQPDIPLASAGYFDGLANVAAPVVTAPFVVEFTWLGPGAPASQPFDIYTESGGFMTLQSGQTVVVPESSTAITVTGLFTLILALTGRARRRGALAPCFSRFTSLGAGAPLLLALLAAGHAHAAPTIGGYEILSIVRVGRTDFEYAIRARATNPGPAITGVSALVTSTSPATTIVKNSLRFGDLAAGVAKTSTDTFKIRQDRRFPFNPAALQWQVSTLDVPDAWAGEWKITVAYHDATTAELQSEETNTLVFCTGETFGLSPLQDTCTGTVTETSVQIAFDAQITIGTCVQTAHCGIAINRTGNTMTGSGQWSVVVQGTCPAASNGAQTFTVSGVRLNKAQGGCGDNHPILLRRFLPYPILENPN